MRFRHLLTVLVFFGLVAVPATGLADTHTYTYTGAAFTTASSPYTTSNSITGSFTVSDPLAPNMNESTEPTIAVPIDSISFSDGVQTLDSADATLLKLKFYTDATGNITYWTLVLHSTANPIEDEIATVNQSGPDDTATNGEYGFATNRIAGTWVGTVNPSAATPEPSSLLLLGTGLLGGASAFRRRFVNAAP